MIKKAKLPSYKNAPVTEVVLSSQFASIEGMTAAHLGLLWHSFRQDFPEAEQHPPVDHQVETFGHFRPIKQDILFQLVNEVPVPRCWFKDPSGNQLIQVQADRFMHNWRKRSDSDQYPRYPDIRGRFSDELHMFEDFAVKENLGPLHFNQCEITYINHIPAGPEWSKLSDLEKVVTFWSDSVGKALKAIPEDVKCSQRFIISEDGQNIGRLYVELQSGLRLSDKMPVFMLNLTARLNPATPDIEGILKRLDLGRIWIIEAFQACGSKLMRESWGEYYE
jgi:uncharacterized protein (TIGR04255 family)